MKIDLYKGRDYFILVKDGLSITVDHDSFKSTHVPVIVKDNNVVRTEKKIDVLLELRVGSTYYKEFLNEVAQDGMVIQSLTSEKVLTRQDGCWKHGSRPLKSIDEFEYDTWQWKLLAM